MGAVKTDIHKSEYQFKLINLSDLDAIKGLIKFRWMIDVYHDNKKDDNIYHAGNVEPVNQELLCLYIDLDDLISKCRLSRKQQAILKLIMDGWTEEDIADTYKQETGRIKKMLDTICLKIKNENDRRWKYDYIYLNYFKVHWEYKQCSKCEEWKPAIDEFFSPDDRNTDGLHSFCKECR